MSDINQFFHDYIKAESLFKDKAVLQSNYIPGEIKHRDDQIQVLAKIVAPGLRREKPSNVFIYGKTGTGKTLTVKHTLAHMQEVAKEQGIPLRVVYVNCKLKRIADTEYRLVAELAKHFGKALPPTGLPTDEIYSAFYKAIDSQKQIVILILDEIDQLVRKIGDEILYNLTRINTDFKNAQMAIIGISNDLIFSNTLDPRVKSSLGEEELVFPPYNAVQLQQILTLRAQLAFRDGVLEEGVIQKCAAYAARDHGDARRALELLRVAGEVAERGDSAIVTMLHIDEAEDKIERDKIVEVIQTQTKQFHATLHAILLLAERHKSIFTGDVYEVYKAVCAHSGLRPLTQRRVSDIIAEMDMLGIINAKVISKGRFGRMREITIGLSASLLPNIKMIIKRELGLSADETIQDLLAQEKLGAFVPTDTATTAESLPTNPMIEAVTDAGTATGAAITMNTGTRIDVDAAPRPIDDDEEIVEPIIIETLNEEDMMLK
jgi:cell division control protein 6